MDNALVGKHVFIRPIDGESKGKEYVAKVMAVSFTRGAACWNLLVSLEDTTLKQVYLSTNLISLTSLES